MHIIRLPDYNSWHHTYPTQASMTPITSDQSQCSASVHAWRYNVASFATGREEEEVLLCQIPNCQREGLREIFRYTHFLWWRTCWVNLMSIVFLAASTLFCRKSTGSIIFYARWLVVLFVEEKHEGRVQGLLQLLSTRTLTISICGFNTPTDCCSAVQWYFCSGQKWLGIIRASITSHWRACQAKF